MSNTHSIFHQLLSSLAATALVSGIVTMGSGDVSLLGQLTGQGATVISQQVEAKEMTVRSPTLHSSAIVLDKRSNDVSSQLILGGLLILLGGALHAFWVVQHQRHAAVHAAPAPRRRRYKR